MGKKTHTNTCFRHLLVVLFQQCLCTYGSHRVTSHYHLLLLKRVSTSPYLHPLVQGYWKPHPWQSPFDITVHQKQSLVTHYSLLPALPSYADIVSIKRCVQQVPYYKCYSDVIRELFYLVLPNQPRFILAMTFICWISCH